MIIGAIVTVGFFLILNFNNPGIDKNSHMNPLAPNRSIIVQIAGGLSGNTLHINVTEKIVSSKPLDEIAWLEIFPELEEWARGKLPWAFFKIEDEKMNDLIDFSRVPSGSTIFSTRTFPLIYTNITCNVEEERVEAHAVAVPDSKLPKIPIKNASTIFVYYPLNDLKPTKSENPSSYHMKFSAFNDIKIELPRGVTIISNNTRTCSVDQAFYEEFGDRMSNSRTITIYDISFVIE